MFDSKYSMRPKVTFHTVDEKSAEQRLDNFLVKTLKGAPKSLIYRIIRKGEVRVNKSRAKPETKLQIGDLVRVPPVSLKPSTSVEHKPGAGLIKLLSESVLYESDELLVVNKPSGLAVHGGSGVNLGLIEALRAMPSAPPYLELVHRLDKDTSGCVMVAKKRRMLKHLQELLRTDGGISKQYYALVQGSWPKRKHKVAHPLLKQEERNGERFVKVDLRRGKASHTEFELVRQYNEVALVSVKPITGRTHQIRVHAQQEGHPLVGDEKYGTPDFNQHMKTQGFRRLFLHAYKLDIPAPDNTLIEVVAELPEDLATPLGRLN
jgi:23S rRNA pseudouridine955/2504/2580 synthase